MKKLLLTFAAVLAALSLTACSSGNNGYMDNTGDDSLYLGTFGALEKTEPDILEDFIGLVTGSAEDSGVKTDSAGTSTENGETGGGISENTLTYTNLAGENIQKNVKEILVSAGIPKNRAEKVFEWVNDYNRCMGSCENFDLKDEFTSVSVPAVDYGDYYPMSTLWFKTNKRDYADVLCRIAAFGLLRDNIAVQNPVDKSLYECYSDTQWLYSDYDAICSNPLVDIDESEREKYFSLYAPVKIKKESTEQEMYDSILKEWEARGIAFDNINCSLITIWLQDGGLTAAGHAAVLADNGNELLLFEKTNPQSPYQATRFSSLEQVKRYMYESVHLDDSRYGLETGTYIVMQNEKML